jgi:PAS domain S-box-containing protein
MAEPSTLEVLARRLNYAGLALLAAAALAFVWAVGFTRGVDGLLEGLVFSAVGLFLPGVATLWVASIIGGAAASHPRARRGRRTPVRWLTELSHYVVAVAAVGAAALVRHWLSPYLGGTAPFATFFLAVIAATWIGGIGPGVLATAASLAIVWDTIGGAPVVPTDEGGRWVGTVLFLTVALAIGGITSALRVARSGTLALRVELDRRDAELDELARALEETADEAAAMLWTCTADGRCSHVNKAWRDYTGQSLEAALDEGWQRGIHPDDVEAWREIFASARRARSHFRVEYRRKRHDGAYRGVVDEARPRLFGDRGFAGFVGRTSEPSQRPGEWPNGGADAS